jgi:Tol biopolymer transport system component
MTKLSFTPRKMLYLVLVAAALLAMAACSNTDSNRITPTPMPSLAPLGSLTVSPLPTLTPQPTSTVTSTAAPTRSPTITQTPTLLPTAILTPTNAIVSLPSGQYLVYSDGEERLHTLSIDGKLQGDLPNAIQDMRAAISLDQKRIAYAIDRGRRGEVPWNTELYIFDLERSETTLMPNGERCAEPSWTLDGNLIATCEDAGGQQEFYWLSSDGQQKVQLSDCAHSPEGTLMGGSCFPANISPDGKWIIYSYTVCDPNPNHKVLDGLYLMNANCIKNPATCETLKPGRLDPLRPCAGSLDGRAWSPDGHYLAVVTLFSEQYGNGIRIYDVDTWQLSRYIKTSEDHPLGPIAWSPDGKWIGYGEVDGIFIVPSSGGKSLHISEALGDVVFWLKVP